eukprot:Gregarina_sp_Pseudo_9__17@NODE_1011_length_1969_cov_1276_638860_g948_i0_p1_GENE_NODE_1011_length_1969_cov_1276_638860_g948_i0NODE_1011_length_1969_cov_1276_638860_g948_i0_p1_ORF_typecomplete_len650_score157_66CBM_5_12_2/PF14600_6/2_2CBM_5_12_2/PF14600_6/18CBM_5_12_2/PF14600_6/2_4e06CBM_5_12/PF02839_14/0_0015CBM_5_12/PF02839_14/1_8e04_NODE_1011_length_1969_cov_1276_638860_g948_i0761950
MKSLIVLVAVASLDQTEAVDCSSAKPWTAQNYQSGGTQVHSKDQLWSNKYAATSYQVPGADPVWNLLGACDPGTAGTGPTIDCSVGAPWKATTYAGERTAKVYKDHVLWTNKYWAGEADVPGVAEVWEKVGACTAGTDSDTGSGPAVSCAGVAGWSAASVYPNPGDRAHQAGSLYEAKWWTSGSPPKAEKEWTLLGACQPGTDSIPPPVDPLALTPAQEELMCTCFDGCARNGVTGPSAVTAATEEECFFTWCPKFNNKDPVKCKDVLARQLLLFYNGPLAPGKGEWPAQVYAPYVDGGLAQLPKLSELATSINVKHFVIAFVTSANYTTGLGCAGGFAGVIPIGVGPTSWNQTKQNNDYLYEEINRLREVGGDVTVSFGGANGVELADAPACQSGDPVGNLKKAYKEVVDTLKLSHIDFDIEGNAVSSVNRATGWAYRFAAVKDLTQELPNLKVWWTLPVLPTGLTQDGMNFVTDLMASGARWDALNLMNMDYGAEELCPGDGMGQCEQTAVDSVAQQLFSTAQAQGLLAQYNWSKWEDVYTRIGSCPMLGMNDVTHEIYTLKDAENAVKIWTSTKKIGLVSNWSVARDAPCADSHVNVDCSSASVQTEKYEFAKIFAAVTSA